MDDPAAGGGADPFRISGLSGDLADQGKRQLEHAVGSLLRDPHRKSPVQQRTFFPAYSGDDFYPGPAQQFKATSPMPGFGVDGADHHPPDAMGENGHPVQGSFPERCCRGSSVT